MAISMHESILPLSSPPPVASNASVALVALMASTSESLKLSSDVLQTCSAPSDFNKSTCSGFLTILIKGILSAKQILTSICPKLDAAAVWIKAEWSSLFMVSTIPSAVSGLTKLDAQSFGSMPSGISMHAIAGNTLY